MRKQLFLVLALLLSFVSSSGCDYTQHWYDYGMDVNTMPPQLIRQQNFIRLLFFFRGDRFTEPFKIAAYQKIARCIMEQTEGLPTRLRLNGTLEEFIEYSIANRETLDFRSRPMMPEDYPAGMRGAPRLCVGCSVEGWTLFGKHVSHDILFGTLVKDTQMYGDMTISENDYWAYVQTDFLYATENMEELMNLLALNRISGIYLTAVGELDNRRRPQSLLIPVFRQP